MSGKPDPYADIDFEEINDQTNLANDEIKCLKVGGYLYLFLGKIFNQWSLRYSVDINCSVIIKEINEIWEVSNVFISDKNTSFELSLSYLLQQAEEKQQEVQLK